MVVHADHGDVLADRESSACGAFVHIPGAGIVEAEESVRMLGVEQIADCGQCRPVVEHIDDQMIVIVEACVPERRLIAFQTIVLRNHRLQATHIGDTCASGLNQSGGGVVAIWNSSGSTLGTLPSESVAFTNTSGVWASEEGTWVMRFDILAYRKPSVRIA